MLAQKDIIEFPFLGQEYARGLKAEFNLDGVDKYIESILLAQKNIVVQKDIQQVISDFIGSFIVISNTKRIKSIFVDKLANYFISRLQLHKNEDIYFDIIFKEIYRTDNFIKKTKDGKLAVSIPLYLKIAKDLVNQSVVRGYVIFSVEYLYNKILKNGFTKYFLEKLNKKKPLFGLDALVQKYDNYHPKDKDIVRKTYTTDKKEYPPCIDSIISKFRNGENVKHFERLTLASFLFKIDKEDELISIFSSASNYNERITRYQLEQIKNADYQVSNCSKIENAGFCFRDKTVCGDCVNPIQLVT